MIIDKRVIENLKKEQLRLANKLNLVKIDKNIRDFKLIVGIDLTFIKEEAREKGIVCFSILKNNINNIKIEYKILKEEIKFPYIPGLLAFREYPLIEELFYILNEEYKTELENKEVLFFIDGHGISHPRALGIASHFGVKLNQISIGIAKRKLFGYYNENNLKRLKITELYNNEKKEKHLGYVINTELITNRKILGSRVLFISPGNNIDCESSLKLFIQMIKNYNLVITELAHNYLVKIKNEKI